MNSMQRGPFRAALLLIILAGLLGLVPAFKAADTLPSQLGDVEFWKMVTDFS